MTKLEYRDLLVETSRTGGFPAWDGRKSGCAYRAPDGRRCAVGLIVPDDVYRPIWDETGTVQMLLEQNLIDSTEPWFPEGMTARDLYEVQTLHDTTAFQAVKEGSWSHAVFVDKLNKLPCFADLPPAAVD